MRTGLLFIISAPSGAGKTSLINAVIQETDNLYLSISHTTRPRRANEQEGVHYFFTDVEKFKEKIKNHDFLEYAVVFDNYYGTSKSNIDSALAKGQDLILEIDWQGADQLRIIHPNIASVYILPPSKDVLLNRLKARAQDSGEVINKRFLQAQADMQHYYKYDYLIINDNFDLAVKQLRAIVWAERLRCELQSKIQADLLQNLLKKG